MCGICGFIHNKNVDIECLEGMNNEMIYRGPDDKGHYLDILDTGEQIGLGHRRLSILDLSSSGHQPMISDDEEEVIVYNGEIYNFLEIKEELVNKGYIFKSNTDTEVIINAYREWGIKCVERFNGMFAIAIFDKRVEELYLIRDRMGVKPLYYYLHENNIVFSSELKPIMKYPYFKKEINMQSLKIYLATQYIPREKSIFMNTYKLLPGHYLKWTKHGIEIVSYWSIENISKESYYTGTYEEAKAELKELLMDAVNIRTISDVPLGAFLSNGIDSSLIVSLLSNQTDVPPKTFTIGFAENQYNEAVRAKKVSQYLQTNHCERYLTMDLAKKYIQDIPYYFDEPMADNSQIATMLVSAMAKEQITVVLSGDAGDELFGGYNKYTGFKRYKRLQKISLLLNEIAKIIPLKKIFRKINVRSLTKLLFLSTDMDIVNADYLTFYDRYPQLLKTSVDTDLSDFYKSNKLSENITEKQIYGDLLTWLPDDVLVKVDRASMAVSLEARAPLLDYRVVEFALKLPLEYKIVNGEKKKILKDILFEIIPENLIGKEKKGFGVPIGDWLREDIDIIENKYFSRQFLDRQNLFDYKTIQKIIGGVKKGKNSNYDNELWTLLVFQMWYQRYLVG